jgi:hypothetical protein
MVFYSKDQDNYSGSILEKPIIDPRSVDKEGAKVSTRNSSGLQIPEFGRSIPQRPSGATAYEITESGGFGDYCIRSDKKSWEYEREMVKFCREASKNGSNRPHGTSCQVSMFSTNFGQNFMTHVDHAAPVSASKPAFAIPSGPASAELKCGEDRNIAMKDVNGRRGLCSTEHLEKVAQPSVFTSRNLEEKKETSSGPTNGSVNTSTSNEAYCQPNLHERLNSLYDSVLVVDNVTIAKEVVGMLTNKYRHLVHACDTEVLF